MASSEDYAKYFYGSVRRSAGSERQTSRRQGVCRRGSRCRGAHRDVEGAHAGGDVAADAALVGWPLDDHITDDEDGEEELRDRLGGVLRWPTGVHRGRLDGRLRHTRASP